MKLTDYKNEKALDLLADLIEPAAEIFSDKELAKALSGNGKKTTAVKMAIKNHKSAVFEIMAAIEGVPVEEYSCNVLTLPIKLLEILNDPELMRLFQFAESMEGVKSFGSATENTEADEH